MNWANFYNLKAKLVAFRQLLVLLALFAAPVIAKSAPQNVQTNAVENDRQELTGERLLYSKVIDSYRAKNLAELNRASELMLKAYPHSVHTDDAIYLKADLLLEKGQLQNTLEVIDNLLRSYPDSNKRVSALFLKAQALEQTRQVKAAQLVRNEIQTRYPGSLEAAKLYSQRVLQQ